MSTQPTSTFQITSWNEKTLQEIEGSAKLTTVQVNQSYTGAIEGTSTVEYLMSYTQQGTASFVGLERISGEVAGKRGTFVIQHVGTFAAGKASSDWTIVAGSGTDKLTSLRGQGRYTAGHGEPAQVWFDFVFEPTD